MRAFRDDDAVIVSIARSPIGRARKGALAGIRPDDLAEQMLRAVIERVDGLVEQGIEDLYLGCAEPHDEHGQNIARRVAVQLGYDGLPGATVNRFCSSSLMAARMAFHGIRAGEGDAYLVGGVECVSRYRDIDLAMNPRFASAAEKVGEQIVNGGWTDPREWGALPDVYAAMGLTAEFVARVTGTSRDAQDEFAARSQQRATAAIESGFFTREITPVALPDGTVVDRDDSPRPGTTVEVLATLEPVFVPEGTVTAGNACPLNDGASAAAVVSGRRARELGAMPKARIVSTGVSALSPEIMGLGPVEAMRQAMRRAGLDINDLDIVEINEAFAAQVIPSAAALGIPDDRLNPHGGAIALGHPFGSTGVRMLATLLNGLDSRDGRFGAVSMCVGGGQGMAMIIERI